jgi:penicillin-binding protein 1B
VGFDDNRELDLEGAHSAAPIWADFMKRALAYREYHDAKPFRAPDGIVTISIDPQSGMPATPSCPTSRPEVYIAGTQPVGACPLHGGRQGTNVAGWEVGPGNAAQPAAAPGGSTDSGLKATEGGSGAQAPAVRRGQSQAAASAPPAPPQAAEQQPKPPKAGFFRRLLNVFK